MDMVFIIAHTLVGDFQLASGLGGDSTHIEEVTGEPEVTIEDTGMGIIVVTDMVTIVVMPGERGQVMQPDQEIQTGMFIIIVVMGFNVQVITGIHRPQTI